MPRKPITRHNVDIHNAVDVVRRMDEAPYKVGADRAMDWLKSKFGGNISKGKHETGKLANELSAQWKQFLGKIGITDVNKATGNSLIQFLKMYAGDNFELPPTQAGRVASSIYNRVKNRPTDEVSEADQDKLLMGVAGGMASLSGTDADDVDDHPVNRGNREEGPRPPGSPPPRTGIPGEVTNIGIDLRDNATINLLDGMRTFGVVREPDSPPWGYFKTDPTNRQAIAVFRGLVLAGLVREERPAP